MIRNSHGRCHSRSKMPFPQGTDSQFLVAAYMRQCNDTNIFSFLNDPQPVAGILTFFPYWYVKAICFRTVGSVLFLTHRLEDECLSW